MNEQNEQNEQNEAPMKAFNSDFLEAIVNSVRNGGGKDYKAIAKEVLGDEDRISGVRDAIQFELSDQLQVLRGAGGGVYLIGADRNCKRMGANLTLSEDLLEKIRVEFQKVGPSIPKGGVSLSFMAARLTMEAGLAKKFEGLIAQALDTDKLPGYYCQGRTIKRGIRPEEKVA